MDNLSILYVGKLSISGLEKIILSIPNIDKTFLFIPHEEKCLYLI